MEAAKAATKGADIASNALTVSQRPWVKIKHRIVTPLTFNSPAWKGPVAKMVIEDTLENVGQSVALDVASWEDVIPIDPDYSQRTAEARQKQWCDADRQRLSGGYVIFPKDQSVQQSTIGPPMEVVRKATIENRIVPGKVGFVLVGCVGYRSSFESPKAPRHQTRFRYFLGEVMGNGAMMPFIYPSGVADKLRLVLFPGGTFAD